MNGHTPVSIARSAQIIAFLLKYRGAGVFTGIDLDSAAAGMEPPEHVEVDAEQFVDDLEALGPTFIKIGQALSTRPDMVPPAYIAALQRMQDEVSPVPFEIVRAVFETEIGVRMSKVFDSVDEVPIGSASLAQVHRAVLRDGREVAVKMQRPFVAEQVRMDLDTIASFAGKADRITDIGRRLRFARLGARIPQDAVRRTGLPRRSREPRTLLRALRRSIPNCSCRSPCATCARRAC